MAKKGKRKNLLKTDPKQKKKEEKEEKKFYNTSRPKTAFNMRKRYDQTN